MCVGLAVIVRKLAGWATRPQLSRRPPGVTPAARNARDFEFPEQAVAAERGVDATDARQRHRLLRKARQIHEAHLPEGKAGERLAARRGGQKPQACEGAAEVVVIGCPVRGAEQREQACQRGLCQ